MDFETGCGCLVALAVGAAIASLPFIRFSTTGNGTHTGYVTAVQQEGIFYRNYNVYVKTDNSSSQEDTYCIDRADRDLVKKAQEVSRNRQLVSVSFEGVTGFGLGLCSDQRITGIEIDPAKGGR